MCCLGDGVGVAVGVAVAVVGFCRVRVSSFFLFFLIVTGELNIRHLHSIVPHVYERN